MVVVVVVDAEETIHNADGLSLCVSLSIFLCPSVAPNECVPIHICMYLCMHPFYTHTIPGMFHWTRTHIRTSYDTEEKKHWLTVQRGSLVGRFMLQDNLKPAWNDARSTPEKIQNAVDAMIERIEQQPQTDG